MRPWIVWASLFSAIPALACLCGTRELRAVAAKSTAIFSGKVIGIHAERGGLSNRIEVKPERIFKGEVVNGAAIEVHTASSGAACGLTFRTGGSYLIFASGDYQFLSTGLCTLTKPLNEAAGEIAWLSGH